MEGDGGWRVPISFRASPPPSGSPSGNLSASQLATGSNSNNAVSTAAALRASAGTGTPVAVAQQPVLGPRALSRSSVTLLASAPPILQQEQQQELQRQQQQLQLDKQPVQQRLRSSSSAILVSDEALEGELEDLLTIPRLPFEIVEQTGQKATARAPTAVVPTSPQQKQSTPPPDHKVAKQALPGPKAPVSTVQRIEKSHINTDIDGRGVIKFCSWCFQYAPQKKLEDRWMGRNAHECGNCFNETCVCMMCSEGACRSYGSSADKLCFKCDGTYSAAKLPTAMKVEGRCSWCLDKTSHTLHNAAKVVGRDAYLCDACGKRTAVCKTCGLTFARGFEDGTFEDACAKCANIIDDWDNAKAAGRGGVSPRVVRPAHAVSRGPKSVKNQQQQQQPQQQQESGVEKQEKHSPPPSDDSIEGWCSWCIEDTFHELVARSLLTRNTYRCLECGHRTLCCLQCDDGMARSGVGWDDKICVSCHLRNGDASTLAGRREAPWDWTHLKGKKDDVFDPARYTHARVMTLLCLASPFKDRSMDWGMVRPFLVLVSMRPSKRNRVSNELGWSSVPLPLFGDAHAEAWEILSAAHNGLQARLYSTVEKLNPLGRGVSWLEALDRVTQIFGSMPADAPAAVLSADRCLQESRTPHSRYVARQEHLLIERVGRLYQKYLIANRLKPPQGEKATAIMNKIKDATGLSDALGLTWAVSVFFKPKTGVPKFSETLEVFLSSREDSQTARALTVVLEIIKQMLRLHIGFAVFPDDYYT